MHKAGNPPGWAGTDQEGHSFCRVANPAALRINTAHVFGLFKPKNPEEHRYYLLPGMGKSNRRQRQLYFRWSIIVGMIIAAIVGLVIYLVQRPGPGFFR